MHIRRILFMVAVDRYNETRSRNRKRIGNNEKDNVYIEKGGVWTGEFKQKIGSPET